MHEILIQMRMRCAIAAHRHQLRRGLRLRVLAAIATTAPMLGWLAACIRFIATLLRGAGNCCFCDPFTVTANRLADALWFVLLGLLIGIPAWWAYRYFVERVESDEIEMRNTAEEVLRWTCSRS